MDRQLLRIVHDNEQDRANCEKWWGESSIEEKRAVWAAIQVVYENPIMEVMSRFAQLAFAEMYEKHGGPK